MADDKMLREMTCDPKFRKVLVTDGKTAVGQALVRALVKAGADIVWVGHAEPWKRHGSGLDDITALPQVSLVPLDLTNGRSVTALAGEIGGKVDIVINNAEVHRTFGIAARRGTDAARAEMDINYFGAAAPGAGIRPGAERPRGRRRGAAPPPGSTCCRSTRWPTSRRTAPFRRPRRRRIRSRNACAPRCARPASAWSTCSRARSTTNGTRTCRRPSSPRRAGQRDREGAARRRRRRLPRRRGAGVAGALARQPQGAGTRTRSGRMRP